LVSPTPIHININNSNQYRLFDSALLQKRPIILRSLLIVATPYHQLNQYQYINITNSNINITNSNTTNLFEMVMFVIFESVIFR